MPRFLYIPVLGFVAFLAAGCGAGGGGVRGGAAGRGAGQLADYSAEAVEQRTEAHARYANAVLLELNEKPEEAALEYFKAALADASNEALVMDASGHLLRHQFKEQALELLKKATSYANVSGGLHARLGLVHSSLGDTNAAIVANRRAIGSDPPSLQGYRQLVAIYLAAGKREEAKEALDEAVVLPEVAAPFLFEFVEFYIEIWRGGGELEDESKAKAVEVLDRLNAMGLENPALMQRLANRYSILGETAKEAEVYAVLMERLPDLQEIRNKLLELYLGSNDHERAIKLLEEAVYKNPTNPRLYYVLGGIAVEMRDSAKAVEYFKKTILLSEEFERAYYDLALAQINLDQPQSALETLGEARRRFKETFVGETYSGLAYGSMKDWSNAITHLVAAEVIARATETNRLNGAFFFQLGTVYERNQRYEEAETYFRKALELAPDFSQALNYLGYMWADLGVKLEEAKQLIERALELEPDNASYLDSLAWVFYKMGKPEQGLEYMLRAVEKATEVDPTLYDHLGDFYSRLNEMDKAREAWHKALEVEPNELIEEKLGKAGAEAAPR